MVVKRDSREKVKETIKRERNISIRKHENKRNRGGRDGKGDSGTGLYKAMDTGRGGWESV